MKITAIKLSVFELPATTPLFDLEQVPYGHRTRWQACGHRRAEAPIHVLHVLTDEGLEGICTVGDARYQTMRREELEALRIMAIGQDPLDREQLDDKLRWATRSLFSRPGWHGAFDNCLWDIAGQAAGLPVCALIGQARPRCRAYYNFPSGSLDAALEGVDKALAAGFVALKDHWSGPPDTNIAWSRAIRDHVGPDIDLLHDAAGSPYTLREALRVGRALEELNYGWFEEAISDRDLQGLQTLCAELDIPVMALETLMHDYELCTAWVRANATEPRPRQCPPRHHGYPQTRRFSRCLPNHHRIQRPGRPFWPSPRPPSLRPAKHHVLRVFSRWQPRRDRPRDRPAQSPAARRWPHRAADRPRLGSRVGPGLFRQKARGRMVNRHWLKPVTLFPKLRSRHPSLRE